MTIDLTSKDRESQESTQQS